MEKIKGKGNNPNSRANLRPQNTRTKEEQREIARKAGKKSGEVRRALKTFKELDALSTTDEQRQKMLDALMKKACIGNIKAFEVYRDTVGLKPIEKIQIAEVDQETIEDIESIFNG